MSNSPELTKTASSRSMFGNGERRAICRERRLFVARALDMSRNAENVALWRNVQTQSPCLV
jgi:hypothetical protein